MNQSLPLSELISPEIFLNALRQKSSRESGVSIDEMKMIFSFDRSNVILIIIGIIKSNNSN